MESKMATYYQRDAFPSSYLSSHHQPPDSHQEPPCPAVDMAHHHQTAPHDHHHDASFLELWSGGNVQPNPHSLSRVDDGQSLQYQELSLSLGFQYDYLHPHLQASGDRWCGTHKVEGVDFSSFDFSDARIFDSRFLKPSREVLEEAANLREATWRLKASRRNGRSDENDSVFNAAQSGRSSDPLESMTSSSGELPASEKHNLQNKVTKLFSLLDEVDRKYREYCQKLRIVEAALDVAAGGGAARPYTELAHHTISRHFRRLRDAVNGRIEAARQSLGEHDDSSDHRVLPRLRHVEKKLRQQRSLSVMRHSWRPQRGLPEGSVSILRAWLFEHFLNPYPKDSEKIMLAKQTGLTRSQIANWFINARVRLWKPMVEDMYKEEFGDPEVNGRSSPEPPPAAAVAAAAAVMGGNSLSSEDQEKESQTNPGFVDSSLVNEMEVNRYQYRFGEPQLPDFMV